MNRICKTAALIAFIALVTPGLAFTQPSRDAATPEAQTASKGADVYVQTLKGVNAYTVSPAGKIALIKGSPFPTVGQMEGINGKYLISAGTNYLHVYAIEANGAVGKQVSTLNTQSYDGAQCGNTNGNGATLDHTGKYFYIELSDSCYAWQTYKLNSNGSLTFIGSHEVTDFQAAVFGNGTNSNIPTIDSSDGFAYAVSGGNSLCTSFVPFRKALAGDLEANSFFTESDPQTPGGWSPLMVAADPNNHLAAVLYPLAGPSCTSGLGASGNRLASYTIDPQKGGISSTNSYSNLASPSLQPYTIGMSYSGNYVALGGFLGLQVFNFSGAAPPTALTGVLLSNQPIEKIAWDAANRLYALSEAGNSPLYIFNVTPAGLVPVAGSPILTGGGGAYGAVGLIVVPK